jgi:hypothetical protein
MDFRYDYDRRNKAMTFQRLFCRPSRENFLAWLLIVAACAAIGDARAQTGDPRIHGDTIIVFDASGSMQAPVAGRGVTGKIVLARQAATRLVAGFAGRNTPMSLGLVAFGLERIPRAPAAEYLRRSCQDVRVIAPLAPLSPTLPGELLREISRFQEYGETPLGLAVQTAIDQLGVKGGSIVVVTDMDETCEDQHPEQGACQVLTRANRGRAPSDKVYVDSIIVTPTRTNPDNSPETPPGIMRLRECPELQATEVNTIVDPHQVDTVTAGIVTRLDRLARGGQDSSTNDALTPANQNDPVRRTVTLIDSRGQPIRNRAFNLRFSSQGQPDISAQVSNGTAAVALPAGVYSLSISSSAGPPQTLEIAVSASSTDIVVTSD